MEATMMDVDYGMTRTLEGVSYTDARQRIEAALQKEGFGILTEIDVKATLKKKLDAEFQPYVILGACNPVYAHQAWQIEPAIGLLLPCNVVVTEDDAGNAVVAAMDPEAMIKVLPDPARLAPAMQEVRERLQRALASL